LLRGLQKCNPFFFNNLVFGNTKKFIIFALNKQTMTRENLLNKLHKAFSEDTNIKAKPYDAGKA
jgi:hypothetical protein